MAVVRALLLALVLAAPAAGETVRVGAAISLSEALAEVASAYEKASGDRVELVLGSSGQIMAQIKSGADIDLFISAATKLVDELQEQGLVEAGSRRVILSNTLVLIAPIAAAEASASFAALRDARVAKVAVGEPVTVPAGHYAKQVFDHLGLSDAIAGKLVYGTNVRQVLTYVERGEVSAGVVYATDARETGERVKVVAAAPEGSHEPIVYPAAVVSASRKKDAARRLLEHLLTPEAQAVFRARGFGPPPKADEPPAAP